MSSALRSRRLELERASNFRDLGGYPMLQGTTAWGKIFRSDRLSGLTEADLAVLHRMGLQTIIDLRNEAEIALHPSSFSGHPAVRYHHVPVDIQAETALDAPERLRNLDLRAHYVELVRDSAGTFAHLFHLLGEAEAYPLAVHCTWGRDRTGVAAALILSAAGVDPDIIVEDYLLSAECLVGSVGRLREQLRQQGYDAEPILANLELRPEYLAGVFAYLSAQGGAEAYLLGLGVTEAELAAFRRQFIAA